MCLRNKHAALGCLGISPASPKEVISAMQTRCPCFTSCGHPSVSLKADVLSSLPLVFFLPPITFLFLPVIFHDCSFSQNLKQLFACLKHYPM